MAVAKKHHYVPQMYLSGFANAAGQLYAVNAEERKCFKPTPANIAAERDFNTIEGVPPDALEKELAKLDRSRHQENQGDCVFRGKWEGSRGRNQPDRAHGAPKPPVP
jgi:Protein of unknown function (DUF4238)